MIWLPDYGNLSSVGRQGIELVSGGKKGDTNPKPLNSKPQTFLWLQGSVTGSREAWKMGSRLPSWILLVASFGVCG